MLSYHPGVSKPLPQDFRMVNKGSGKDLGWEEEASEQSDTNKTSCSSLSCSPSSKRMRITQQVVSPTGRPSFINQRPRVGRFLSSKEEGHT